MLTLLLISGFTAFVFAVINQLISVLDSFMDMRLIRAFLCLLTSAGATGLSSVGGVRQFIIYSVSGAFFGSLLVIIAERINTYQAAVIHAVGKER
jgi:hypothetical protein